LYSLYIIQDTQTRSQSSSRFSASKEITQHRGALVLISEWHVICTRVPLALNRTGMTVDQHLVLEVDNVDVKEGTGDSIYGTPKDVETGAKIQMWIEGLRQGGGGGCVIVPLTSVCMPLKHFLRSVLVEQKKNDEGTGTESKHETIVKRKETVSVESRSSSAADLGDNPEPQAPPKPEKSVVRAQDSFTSNSTNNLMKEYRRSWKVPHFP
jgi:hypothetical protein